MNRTPATWARQMYAAPGNPVSILFLPVNFFIFFFYPKKISLKVNRHNEANIIFKTYRKRNGTVDKKTYGQATPAWNTSEAAFPVWKFDGRRLTSLLSYCRKRKTATTIYYCNILMKFFSRRIYQLYYTFTPIHPEYSSYHYAYS